MKRRDPELFLRRFFAMEETLVSAGLSAMPEWWKREGARVERRGKRRSIIRKGRRVYASTCFAPRLGAAEMLYGQHEHVPGTPPLIYAFVSVKRDEAAKRLIGVRAILDILGEPYTVKGDTVELTNRPATFAVITANHRTNVGDTVAFAWLDEVARWNDDETGANPAEQVVGSLAPALATLPNARMWLVSSPLGADDYHARCFDLGENDVQSVAFGATWTINPSLTEADTRALEPIERIWLREYAAIPQASETAVLERRWVENAIESDRHQYGLVTTGWGAMGIIDSSAGRGDSWTWGACTWAIDDNGKSILNVGAVNGVDGRFEGQYADIIQRSASELYRLAGCSRVYGDSYLAPALEDGYRRCGLTFESLAWTAPRKVDGIATMRRWFHDGAIVIPNHPQLIGQLIGLQERIAPSGALTYGARRGAHDDYAAIILMAAILENEGLLRGSPIRGRGGSSMQVSRLSPVSEVNRVDNS